MRVLASFASLAFLASFVPADFHIPPPVPASSRVEFAPIAFNPEDMSQRSVGSLRLLGSWQLSSEDPRFGGLSAMSIEFPTVTGISDGGYVYQWALPASGSSTHLSVTKLQDGPGAWSKRSRDLEALSISDGRAWISLEFSKAIWRYQKESWQGSSGAKPAAMAEWPRNGGAEAILRLGDNRFLVFSERHWLEDGTSEALLFHGDPSIAGTRATTFRYRGPSGYRVTDAAMLSDGRLLLLHRKASLIDGFSAKFSIAELPEVVEGLTLTSDEIATIEPPLATSNYEALAVTRENGRDTIWVASDDNFSPLLRTLLLKFQLVD